MLRRSFLAVLTLFTPRWLRAQSIDSKSMRDLAAVVLPESLGRKRTDKIAGDFLKWIAEYQEGVHIASGYGNPRTQTVPPNPSKNYAAQLAEFNGAITKESVAAALEKAKIDRIPNRPNGRHVASDLMSYFFNSADGEDLLYDAEIKRDDCRGLSSSMQRPKRFSA
jgi:hypothetical protein